MFNDTQVSKAIETMTDLVLKHFLPLETARELKQQRAGFDGDLHLSNVLTPAQQKAREEGRAFEPDLKRAEHYAKVTLESGIGIRLRGAFSCYRAGMQLECLRHILLALCTVSDALSWDKASAYLNEQNRVLQKMLKDKPEGS